MARTAASVAQAQMRRTDLRGTTTAVASGSVAVKAEQPSSYLKREASPEDVGPNKKRLRVLITPEPGWKHPDEMDYILYPNLSDDEIINFMLQNVLYSIPKQGRGSSFCIITQHSKQPPGYSQKLTIPTRYRIPLLWVTKYMWTSLHLVLSAGEWEEFRVGILHVARLLNLFFTSASTAAANGMGRHWRCATFDRALVRYRNHWMLQTPDDIAKFFEEHGEVAYNADVLLHGDWKRWAIKGFKGFDCTDDEITNGIGAKTFIKGLRKEGEKWIWPANNDTPNKHVETSQRQHAVSQPSKPQPASTSNPTCVAQPQLETSKPVTLPNTPPILPPSFTSAVPIVPAPVSTTPTSATMSTLSFSFSHPLGSTSSAPITASFSTETTNLMSTLINTTKSLVNEMNQLKVEVAHLRMAQLDANTNANSYPSAPPSRYSDISSSNNSPMPTTPNSRPSLRLDPSPYVFASSRQHVKREDGSLTVGVKREEEGSPSDINLKGKAPEVCADDEIQEIPHPGPKGSRKSWHL